METHKKRSVTKKKTIACSTNLWKYLGVAAAAWSLVPLSDACHPKAESRSACFLRQEVQIAMYIIATIKIIDMGSFLQSVVKFD